MAKLKLTKLQKLGVRAWREKQNQVLHSHQNQGENKKKKKKKKKKNLKTRLLVYTRIIIYLTYLNAAKFPYFLTATCWISAVAK